MTSQEKGDALVQAMVILARAGVPTDVQALLVSGDPERGIEPHALMRVLEAQRREFMEEIGKPIINLSERFAEIINEYDQSK